MWVVMICTLLMYFIDHRYWREGFSYGCVPDCVSNYKDIILNIGKSLNLLRLCCPKVSVTIFSNTRFIIVTIFSITYVMRCILAVLLLFYWQSHWTKLRNYQ